MPEVTMEGLAFPRHSSRASCLGDGEYVLSSNEIRESKLPNTKQT